MGPEQVGDWARQVSAVAVMLVVAYALWREWIVLGREYRVAIAARDKAEQKADEWETFALRQLGISDRAVGVAERAIPRDES
jgi:hypothetical protein